ncbi:MAG: hypothetical protein ACLQHF_14510, partial [Terracidiphilus sp.]
MSAGSVEAGTLAAGASCTLPISFEPTTGGSITGSLVLTDNALNAAPPGYATQAILLSGTGQAAQTITFAALPSQTYGAAPFTVSATASSGLAVSFASTTSSVCTVSGSTVTLVSGEATCTIEATQAGNDDYQPAPAVAQSFWVYREAQTITFEALPAKTYGAAPFTVSATASSGLPVSFTSTTTSVCTVSGSTVTLVSAGANCTIEATQAGNSDYGAAPATTRTFWVNKEAQTITFAALPDKTYGVAPFTVSATASSGLPVSYASTTTSVCAVSGSTVTLVSAGANCTIEATQAGNGDYGAAPATTRTFWVNKEAQTITFAALPDKTYGVAPFTV